MEERNSILPLSDAANQVITSLTCQETHGLDSLPENVDFCDNLRVNYEKYEYTTLMNTTFGLVPSGRSPGTYRLAEVMSAGAIPVIVSRDIVRPFREEFDWPSFSFVFAPDQVGEHMMKTLRAVTPEMAREMQVCEKFVCKTSLYLRVEGRWRV